MDPRWTRVIHRELNRTYPTLVRGDWDFCLELSWSGTEKGKSRSRQLRAFRAESGLPPWRVVWCLTPEKGPPMGSRAITCSTHRR